MANRTSPLIHYTLDASASQFTAQVMGSRTGQPSIPARRFSIDEFSGFAVLGRDRSEGSKAQMSINPRSLNRMDQVVATDREPIDPGSFHEILEVERHLAIIFEGKQVSASGNGE